MLHVEVSRITGDPRRLADAVSYLTSQVRPVEAPWRGGQGVRVFSSARPA